MTAYADYLSDVLGEDIIAGRRQYTDAERDAVMDLIESWRAEDRIPDLLMALMDRLQLVADRCYRLERSQGLQYAPGEAAANLAVERESRR